MLKVLLLVAVGAVAVLAAEGEAAVETKGKVVVELVSKPLADSDKKVKPVMHPRGALRHTHVRAFPVGYEPSNYRRDVQYFGGGAPVTTEELHRHHPHADTRIPVDLKGASKAGYNWETPEYQFEYEQRTGDVAGVRAGSSLPVVHHPRGSLPAGRRARTPKAPRSRKPKASKAAAKAPKPQAPSAKQILPEIFRLEKGLAYALRKLGDHSDAIAKAERRSEKHKQAIRIIAKHVAASKKRADKFKKAIKLIAAQVAADEKRANINVQNINALRTFAHKAGENFAVVKKYAENSEAMRHKIKRALRLVASTLHSDEKRISNLVNLVNQLVTASHVNAKNWEALRHLKLGGEGKDVKRLEKSLAFALKTLGDHQARLEKTEKVVASVPVHHARLEKALAYAIQALGKQKAKIRKTQKSLKKVKNAVKRK